MQGHLHIMYTNVTNVSFGSVCVAALRPNCLPLLHGNNKNVGCYATQGAFHFGALPPRIYKIWLIKKREKECFYLHCYNKKLKLDNLLV